MMTEQILSDLRKAVLDSTKISKKKNRSISYIEHSIP